MPQASRYSTSFLRIFVILALILTFFVMLPVSWLLLGSVATAVWGLCFCSFVVLIWPIFYFPRYDIFQPLNFVALTTLIGVTLRSIYIVTSESSVADFFLLGRPVDFLLEASLIILLGVITLTVGYFLKPPKIKPLLLLRCSEWSTGKLFLVVFVFVAVAIIAMILFIGTVGIEFSSLSDLSAKRSYVVAGADYQFAALGYHRWAASLIAPAFYLLLTWFTTSAKRWLSLPGITVVLIGCLATVFPFFANSRGAFVMVPITALLIWHYMRKPISSKTLLLAVVAVALAVTTLSAFRLGFDNLSELRPYLTGEKAFESIVGNRNFFGVDKTAHIIDAVPEILDYQYGKTLVLWLAAPVPRTLWKEKPVISTGQIIGEEIFGSGIDRSGGGVPPGFVAEMYWNFGFFGVFLGMFLLGYWLRAVYQYALPYLSTHKSALLIYTAIMIPFALGLLGASVSAAILEAAANVIPIFLALLFIEQRKDLRHAQ